jgi:hypothetical protein
MPIRHAGLLASRASTSPRDHFCRSTIARIETYNMERLLADADNAHCSLEFLIHNMLLVFGAPCQLVRRGRSKAGTIPLSVSAVLSCLRVFSNETGLRSGVALGQPTTYAHCTQVPRSGGEIMALGARGVRRKQPRDYCPLNDFVCLSLNPSAGGTTND